MDRPQRSRSRPSSRQQELASFDGSLRSRDAGLPVKSIAVGLGVLGAVGFLAYRYLAAPKTTKKSRSKHGKKSHTRETSAVEEETPKPHKKGASPPLTPPRSASPPVPTKAVDTSSRMDQLVWWMEIARDQFESRGLKHAKFYAEKALALGASVPDFKDTLSYCQMQYIAIFVSPDREAKSGELQALADTLEKMDATEQGKVEYGLYKGRILSTLCDAKVKHKEWAAAETLCESVLKCFEMSFSGQQEQLDMNLGIQYYQLAVIKRNLKKLDQAVDATVKAYEHIVKSKMKPEFSSSVARQRADILDALGRFDEAKVVMKDHLERVETLYKAEKAAKAAKSSKAAPGESGENGDVDQDEQDGDEDDPASASQQPMSPNNLTDNMLFLARLHYEHKEYEEAIQLLSQAFELVPSPYYLSLKASALFEVGGRDSEAVQVQKEILKLRPGGELPIATSRNLMTKVYHLRQTKIDGPYTAVIQVSNQPVKTLSEELRLPPGTLIEMYVRRHEGSEEEEVEVVGSGVIGTASSSAPSSTKSVGPFIYIVNGNEPNGIITIKALLGSSTLQSNSAYEIVLYQYPNQESRDVSQRIGTHRQMARAMPYHSLSMARLMSMGKGGIGASGIGGSASSPLSSSLNDISEADDNFDDYLLPEPSEAEAASSHVTEAQNQHNDEVVETIDTEEIQKKDQNVAQEAIVAVQQLQAESDALRKADEAKVEEVSQKVAVIEVEEAPVAVEASSSIDVAEEKQEEEAKPEEIVNEVVSEEKVVEESIAVPESASAVETVVAEAAAVETIVAETAAVETIVSEAAAVETIVSQAVAVETIVSEPAAVETIVSEPASETQHQEKSQEEEQPEEDAPSDE